MPKIKGGYVLQPRIIKHSKIWNSPPYVREIWSYLLMEANHHDSIDYNIKRGQLFRDYKTIRDDLCWYVGYRKEQYNENQMKKAMKALREDGRITTVKALGGVLITICNYDYYQNSDNYDRTKEGTNESTAKEPMKNHPLPSEYKKEKNDKNDKNTDTKVSLSNAEHSTQDKINYDEVVNFFNSKTNGVFGFVRLPISDKRKSAIRARIRAHGKVAFGEAISKATSSDFLKGSTKWKATFDWIITETNFSKILEGNYDNRNNNENNGNNGITAKQQQRHKVAGDVYQDLLSNVFSENDK